MKEDINFIYKENEFDGVKITTRQWKINGEIDIKLDDSFACSLGFASLNEMIYQNYSQKEIEVMRAVFGGFPQWVRVFENGAIVPVASVPNNLISNIAEA